MAQGRSSFTVEIKNPTTAEATIKKWLIANKFKPTDLKGEQVYVSKNIWTGRKFFNYDVENNSVTFQAWIHGVAGDFDLDTAPQSIAKAFHEMLNDLLLALKHS